MAHRQQSRGKTRASPHSANSLSAGLYLLVFALALAFRAGLGTVQLSLASEPRNLELPDEVQYWQMAQSLDEGTGLRDELGFRATRMPLFPAFLSLFTGFTHGLIAAKATLWVIGSLVAVLTAGLAATMFDRRVGLCAGLLVAIDPFLVFFSSLLLTETLYLVAVVGLWWVLWPVVVREGNPGSYKRWIIAGLVAAFCVYIRESSAGLVAALLLLVLVVKRLDGRVLLGTAIVATTVAVSLLPWAIRNYRVTGDFCWLTHRAGISLYDGVGPQATGASDLGDIKQMHAVRGLDEVAWNRYFLDRSIAAVKAEPGRILRLAAVKIGRMWNPVPNAEAYRSRLVRIVAAGWTIPTFALAAAGVIMVLWRGGRTGAKTVAFLLLPALYLTTLHSLFVGSVRYRLGAIPLLEVLAAVAVIWLFDRAGKRRLNEGTIVVD